MDAFLTLLDSCLLSKSASNLGGNMEIISKSVVMSSAEEGRSSMESAFNGFKRAQFRIMSSVFACTSDIK